MLSAVRPGRVLYKTCLRCHGDLVLDEDLGDPGKRPVFIYACLQCGGRLQVDVISAARTARTAS